MELRVEDDRDCGVASSGLEESVRDWTRLNAMVSPIVRWTGDKALIAIVNVGPKDHVLRSKETT